MGFSEGGALDAQGNAWFAWGDCETSSCKGVPTADYRVSETLAGTSATSFADVATGDQGPDCPFSSCGFSYFGPQDDIGIDGPSQARQPSDHQPVQVRSELHVRR